ncbi:disease resistance protein At4g27190-like [Fagus crenata]
MTKANKDYMTFDSRVSTVEGLMEALRDANINLIGVWGMSGVGKTTLVREVANQVKENKLFDDVAIAEVVFPSLERLELSSISEEIQHNQHQTRSSCKLTNMQASMKFQNLLTLEMNDFGSLKYLLPFSTARLMVQLKHLHISKCKVMEEILLTEDLGGEEIILGELFPRLECMMLKDLPILKRFCVGSNIKFQSLMSLVIEKCPKLKSFIFKPVNSVMTVIKELNEMNSDEITYIATQPLFNEEVAFPSLETLKISHMENLKIIWHNQAVEDSFFMLKILVVECCENLMNIFQSNMLTRLQSLEKLIVEDCGSLQEIFELQGKDVRETHVVTTIPLEELILRCLPKMKHVWNKDPQGIFSFQNLQLIDVTKCESLKSLFPVSIARILLQLEKLVIVDCGVEEIVANEDGVEATTRFVFPKVTQLILRKLPKLKWFYQQMHTSEWPLLKELNLCGCDQIEIFVSKILSLQEMVEQSQPETSLQPLFLVGEVRD